MLVIKFWLNTGSNRIYIETEVEDEHYLRGGYLHLKEGSIPRSMVEGTIEQEWVEDPLEENGDLGLQQLL